MSSIFVASKIICVVTVGYSNASHQTTFWLSSLELQTAPPGESAYVHNPAMAPNTTPTKREKICTMRVAGYSNDEICATLIDRHDLSD
ncbi:uncharacterized protein LACBIDRAFT_318496 [Laccaria bicolor S238N-H82]|uniref:Predicted protein n=1 Tax=Laccaria bicolor (strain S238N-H82 / ATCC MYA-4686) TaxID=486041 RepID=B0E2J6_LACBS|nr:uncharacterized protein LACBIDRAFT_318491 [Laccaria bicolor S238N-H82]XP_001890419.1 uncharacterized protein LACBIDRAFT_318496 [Laccaria bicolor S238N-H82]EDQ98929.1 predicted protein [Laccaria bicolor S238N-H82]EDQ98938.1 predicted protein [Laccaria bicolor S238N-H82]|eukprot:XP_001890410.1 predicted protein [Laccaria bicolor S238N-H82]